MGSGSWRKIDGARRKISQLQSQSSTAFRQRLNVDSLAITMIDLIRDPAQETDMDITTINETVREAAGTVDIIVKTVRALRALLKPDRTPGSADIDDLRGQLTNLFEAAVAAKEAQLRLLEMVEGLKTENAALKEELGEIKAFKAEAVAYGLRAVAPHTFAYAMKETTAPQEETPLLCVHCFDDGRKSVLQFEMRDTTADRLRCPRCKTTIWLPREQTERSAPTRSGGWTFSGFGE